jgi:hypothetical protein
VAGDRAPGGKLHVVPDGLAALDGEPVIHREEQEVRVRDGDAVVAVVQAAERVRAIARGAAGGQLLLELPERALKCPQRRERRVLEQLLVPRQDGSHASAFDGGDARAGHGGAARVGHAAIDGDRQVALGCEPLELRGVSPCVRPGLAPGRAGGRW